MVIMEATERILKTDSRESQQQLVSRGSSSGRCCICPWSKVEKAEPGVKSRIHVYVLFIKKTWQLYLINLDKQVENKHDVFNTNVWLSENVKIF